MTDNVIQLKKPGRKAPAPFEFTKTACNAAIEEYTDAPNTVLRDTRTRGLGLRFGRKNWSIILERRIDGKLHKVKLGTYGVHTDFRVVRNEAERIGAELSAGTYQPRKVKAEKEWQAVVEGNTTLGEAFQLYQDESTHLRGNTIESYARAILHFCDMEAGRDEDGKADPIGTATRAKLVMAEIDATDVGAAYDKVCADKSPATANVMLRSLRAIWNLWADHIKHDGRNPFERITRRRGRVVKVKPRSGAIAPGDRAGWWTALEAIAARSENSTARALQFLFLTGLRRDEALALSWSEVDLKAGTITIPASRMKAGEELTRPITDGMRRIFDAQRKANPKSVWVFPATRGGGHLVDTRKTLKTLAPVVTNHDLRRGFIVAGELARVPSVAIKMLVGHSTSDVTKDYAKAIVSELPDLAAEIEAELMRGVE